VIIYHMTDISEVFLVSSAVLLVVCNNMTNENS